MRKTNFFRKLGDFALGKGFYIVLFLCVAAIGISGYYLIQSFRTPAAPLSVGASGSAVVTLPDPEPPAPVIQTDPEPVLGQTEEPEEQPAAAPTPAQTPAQPKAQEQTQTPAPAQPKAPARAEQPAAAVVYTWPVNGAVLRDFSVETLALDPTLGDWRTHGGLDVAAQAGSRVLAMAPGSVTQVYRDGLMGVTVAVDHGSGLESMYCGLAEEVPVREGDAVDAGTVLGTVGDTAIAEVGVGPHLHLETWLNGARVDPLDYLPQR